MPRPNFPFIVLGCLCFLFLLSPIQAETIDDPVLGFTLELPPEFIERPEIFKSRPDVAYAFQYGEVAEGERPVFLVIKKFHGTISPEGIQEKDLPEGFRGKLFETKWQGFDVAGSEVSENLNGVDTITYNVPIPLKVRAIQVKLFGPADRTEELNTLLPEILDNLKGESNWSSSEAISTQLFPDSYATVLLVMAIVGVVLSLVFLWFASTRTPKGTVLIVAVALYASSWQFDDVPVREMHLVIGMMRMIGFAGGILGLIDLIRRSKTKQEEEKEPIPPEPESETGS
ncbi:hypothetical protein [Bremerella sp. P1]|uniref:hypothetical protein n=1 Tax=Bremerella sp. P1 TaxID=3026424 RepID=UPI00236755E8|nr:hypothetical protein [Bremerella sp. P1]WDI40685.1 hypothetical protein PSR63_19615 [Bremerella sp. P1]